MPYGVIPYGVNPYGNDDAPVIGDVVEVELPGVYVDALVFDEATESLLLLNMVPEKGSTGNAVDTHVVFEVFDTTGGVLDASTLSVTIDGVAAVVAGAFQAGFNGAASAVTGDATDVLHVVIDPTTDFLSESIVVVDVEVENDAALELVETYVFKIDDVTAPKLLSALALDHMVVRLTFDEAMKAVDAAATDDALNPDNYAFSTPTQPAVPIFAVSVVKVTDFQFDITLDIEMTPGAIYTVVVSGAEDAFGNVIAAPDDDATFSGYVCPAPAERDFLLWDMLPPLQKQMDADVGKYEQFIGCFQEVTDLLLCLIDRFAETFDPDYAPEVFVDAMLADLGNPFKFALSLADKRRLIRVLLDIYRSKGTAAGIVNAVRFFLGIEVEVEPLNDPEGQWQLGEDELGVDTYLAPSDLYLIYSFRIIAPFALTTEERTRIREIAVFMKPAHEHLVEIQEPVVPVDIDHWSLGLSLLGDETDLHE